MRPGLTTATDASMYLHTCHGSESWTWKINLITFHSSASSHTWSHLLTLLFTAQVWEPESPANTSTALNHHRHKLSPYTDMPLKGRVIATVVQGHFVALLDAVSKHACGTPVGHDLK
jgi:hypothetical protein